MKNLILQILHKPAVDEGDDGDGGDGGELDDTRVGFALVSERLYGVGSKGHADDGQLGGLDNEGGDPAKNKSYNEIFWLLVYDAPKHVSEEWSESLHEVRVLCAGAGDHGAQLGVGQRPKHAHHPAGRPHAQRGSHLSKRVVQITVKIFLGDAPSRCAPAGRWGR